MKKIILLLTILLVLPIISASCSENQIDINSASLEKLVEIIYIGDARAEQMITLRPFSSVDDMIKINGIGEITLNKIKEQGLACVNEDDEENIQENKEKNIEELTDEKKEQEKTEDVKTTKEKTLYNKSLSPIILTKDIKSDDNLKLNKNDYAMYGFIVFCILLVFLFLIRKKKYSKNEFN